MVADVQLHRIPLGYHLDMHPAPRFCARRLYNSYSEDPYAGWDGLCEVVFSIGLMLTFVTSAVQGSESALSTTLATSLGCKRCCGEKGRPSLAWSADVR